MRSVFKEEVGLEVAAINDLADPRTLAHLLRQDSAYGAFGEEVELKGDSLVVGGQEIKLLSEKDPAALPWEEMGIQVVLECTGVFTEREKARAHLEAGAEAVVISANAESGETPHFVYGINHQDFNPEQDRVSAMCSCTTNCATPVVNVLDEAFNLLKAHMLTIHAVTASQNLVDGPHEDLRRARSALVNSVPTTTGSDKAVVRVLPELRGRLSASAVRVPVICGSLLEVVASLEEEVSEEEVNDVFRSVGAGALSGLLSVSEEPLVSTDIIGTREAAIVDLPSTEALDLPEVEDENLVKVIAWYDNEYAYSYRLAKFAEYGGEKLVR